MIKRLFDIIVAVLALLVLIPVFLCIALSIKCSSMGPIFFRQERVGRLGRHFRIFKFRTMYMNAEASGLLTIGKDPRITPIGQWLRQRKLDELPQLIDVLRGTMSLVGPRPEVPKYVALYPAKAQPVILSLRPGITDWASIEMIQENQLLAISKNPERDYINHILPKKIKYYLSYAQHHTLLGDIKILFATLYHLIKSP